MSITTDANARQVAHSRGWDGRESPAPGSLLEVASSTARSAAKEIEQGALRREATPIRRAFVRGLREPDVSSPMLALYRGGRSGVVPIQLYLAILWKCSRPPFDTQVPARAWAALLDLSDPAGAGARRVRTALVKLQDHNLIQAHTAAGDVTQVSLLREDGTGRKYSSPSAAYMKAAGQKRGRQALEQHEYLRLNNDLWTGGHLQVLRGPALAMLLILMGEGGDRGLPVWMSTSIFAQRYALSPTTRSKGIRELVERGLVSVDRQAVPDWPGASVFQRQRFRDVYTLQGPAVAPAEDSGA